MPALGYVAVLQSSLILTAEWTIRGGRHGRKNQERGLATTFGEEMERFRQCYLIIEDRPWWYVRIY